MLLGNSVRFDNMYACINLAYKIISKKGRTNLITQTSINLINLIEYFTAFQCRRFATTCIINNRFSHKSY